MRDDYRDTERTPVPLELDDTAVSVRPAPGDVTDTDLVIVGRRAATECDWPPPPPAPAALARRATFYAIPTVDPD